MCDELDAYDISDMVEWVDWAKERLEEVNKDIEDLLVYLYGFLDDLNIDPRKDKTFVKFVKKYEFEVEDIEKRYRAETY